MQSAAELMDDIFKKYRLQINQSKTELMTIDPTGEDENKDSKIWIQNVPIVSCQTFRYLGSLINHRECTTGDTEINTRIDCADIKFNSMKNLFLNRKIHRSVDSHPIS